LDAGRVDFSEVATGKRLPHIHPGEILRDDFLQPMKISVYALALAIKVPRSRVNDIVLGRRGITADTAFGLACYFGTTPDFRINSRRVTIWRRPVESFADGFRVRSGRGPPDESDRRVGKRSRLTAYRDSVYRVG
jgi:addiction module HigA family antidote